MRLPLTAAFVLLACLAVTSRAQDVFQEGTTITFELQNGDKLTGLLEEADQARLVILHDILGRISLPRAAVKPPAPKEEVKPYEPWVGKFDMSLSGSEGNSDNQTFRAQLDVRHEDDGGVDSFTAWWRYQESRVDNTTDPDGNDMETSEEKFFSQFRHDWKLEDSKWRPFWQASYERDLFAGWEARYAAAAGAGYQHLDGPEHWLASRYGFGVNSKSGIDTAPPGESRPDAVTYEALLAIDWIWKITELSTLTASEEFYPSISNSPEFRSITRVAYDMRVGADSPWYWKLGVDNFYDSDPGSGRKPSDWNYYAGIGRSF